MEIRSRIVLEERLASGGMAEVFRAREEGPEGVTRSVVVKRMRASVASDPELRTMFLDEARLLARLRHPHVAQLLAVVRDDDVARQSEEQGLCLVMEHVEGVTVRALMDVAKSRNVRLFEELALSVALPLAETLAYVHALVDPWGRSLEVVHRDLHPSNLMLTRDGVLKLLDFGVAHALTAVHETATGMVKGTDGYMAPEQALGGRIDARADVYALGILMYEMLTGVHPFEGLDGLLLVERLDSHGGPSPRARVPSLSSELAGWVEACMARKPDDRPSAESAARAIAAELGRRGVVPTHAGTRAMVESILGWPSPAARVGGA